MKHRFYTLDVFTDQAFGGNPLAVFPDGANVPEERMLDVTREFNLSETVFVLPPDDPAHARKLRIFTPGGELPFAGHPTIGTTHLLAAIGAVPTVEGDNAFVLEEGVGPIRVRARVIGGNVEFAQLSAARMPERLPKTAEVEEIAAALSLTANDFVDDGVGPATFSCGVPFLFARLRDIAAVRRAKLNQAAWERGLTPRGINEMYFFAEGGEFPGSDIHARMFAPGFGIPEDPATGGAAVALAGYLRDLRQPGDGTVRWTIEQGVEMGRPSLLRLEADISNGAISGVRLGGQSVIVTEGQMEIS